MWRIFVWYYQKKGSQGFSPENWGWTSWMEALGKGGMFLYLWCKQQGENVQLQQL